MNFSGITMLRSQSKIAGIGAACLFGGLAAATVAAPAAIAAPDDQCSAGALANTVSTVTNSARQYFASHPGANQVATVAMNQPQPEAEANVRGYFTANPADYYELRGILAPIGEAQSTCNVTVLPGELASAYNLFMAG